MQNLVVVSHTVCVNGACRSQNFGGFWGPAPLRWGVADPLEARFSTTWVTIQNLVIHVARFSRDVPTSNSITIWCASRDGWSRDPLEALKWTTQNHLAWSHLFWHRHVSDRYIFSGTRSIVVEGSRYGCKGHPYLTDWLGQTIRTSLTEFWQKNLTLASHLSRSLKVTGTDTEQSATYDFLLVIHSNHGPISCHIPFPR